TMWLDWEITLPRVGEKSTNAGDGVGLPRIPSRTRIDSATVLINAPLESCPPAASLYPNARPLQENSPRRCPHPNDKSHRTAARPWRSAKGGMRLRSGAVFVRPTRFFLRTGKINAAAHLSGFFSRSFVTSHNLISRSQLAVARVLPSGLNATAWTCRGEPCGIPASSFPVPTSHSFTPRFHVPTALTLPSPLNAPESAAPPALTERTSCSLLTSHSLTVSSSLAEPSALPSGAHATEPMPLAWALSVACFLRPAASHRQIVPSRPALASALPSGENAT